MSSVSMCFSSCGVSIELTNLAMVSVVTAEARLSPH